MSEATHAQHSSPGVRLSASLGTLPECGRGGRVTHGQGDMIIMEPTVLRLLRAAQLHGEGVRAGALSIRAGHRA